MFDVNLFIYQIKTWWKQLQCKHKDCWYSDNGDFHVQTCKSCKKQFVERKIS